MEIDVKELKTYDISDDGTSVELGLVDESGNAAHLHFRIPDLGNLAMTLPSLIEAALRRQYRDGAFRYAYPIGSWSIEEAADPSHLIVTLRTKDGFGVSFSMGRRQAIQLGFTLSEVLTEPGAVVTH